LAKYNQTDELDRACSAHGENRTAYRVLVEKPEEPTRWHDIIKTDIKRKGLDSPGSG
jgi:hypothetical protein